MKKLLSLGLLSLSVVALVACSQGKSSSSEAGSSSEAKTEQSSEKKIPSEYKTAVTKAKQYAETVHLSKEGLRSQLVNFEKYSQEAADYAVDNSDIDYKKQALEKAKQYQETMAMSPEAIREQLVNYEKFTQEEADSAVSNLN
jgi:putative host cell surface-exposed lipoprotein|nr:MAG TPA: Host cell surface-exposed lipoprotein [Caudoviricetes sp.]DAM98064.1 MAG TPA: Host cell surface-exposed lipoprotein [Caudoviricetes sp.]DAQ47869.1 MAG TPA: Host cell surface-exposed lipoprotein [Caudoviricetes sp.]